MKLRINESIYEIIYDYTSEEGYEENNNVEQFEGTWTDLQDYLKQMRRNGCYNISANEISDYDLDIDESFRKRSMTESYGTLADYLERHLDSWYGRLNEIGEDIEELGLDVDEINGEYIIVHATEPDGEDVYCKIRLGGTERTISLEKFEMMY